MSGGDGVMLSLPRIERRLFEHSPSTVSTVIAPKRAAVACVLRFESGAPEVLLMKRTDREGDRWSGQVSFPGGRAEEQDPDPVSTAVRETAEEVGFPLATHARLLGQLDDVRAVARGRLLPMAIRPFVFVQTAEHPLDLNHEAEAAFWLPLDRALAGELAGKYRWGIGPAAVTLDCWRYEGFVVWGLTYRMLNNFLSLVSG